MSLFNNGWDDEADPEAQGEKTFVGSGKEDHNFNAPLVMRTSKLLCTPMAIDLIIREVLLFLPRNQLLNCRLIDRAWNKNAISVFSQNPNYICCINDLKKFCTDCEVADVASSLFNRIELSLEICALQDCLDFFTKVKPRVKELIIKEELVELKDEGRNLKCSVSDYQLKLRCVFQNIPELESLKLQYLPESVLSEAFVFNNQELKSVALPKVRNLDFRVNDVTNCSSAFREGLFSLVPNVKNYRSRGPRINPDYNQLLTVPANQFSLQKLGFTYPHVIPAKELYLIRMKNQKLNYFGGFIIIRNEDEVRDCELFLNSQSETLEKLCFHIVSPSWKNSSDEIPLPLPFMKRLKYLLLDQAMFKRYRNSTFVSIQPKNIPSLNKLTIDNFYMLCKVFDDVFPSVHELRFAYCYGCDDTCHNRSLLETLRNLGKIFPNLRRLRHPGSQCLGDEALLIAFSLPKLEELDLKIIDTRLERNFNYTLSGISAESAGPISHSLANNASLVPSIDNGKSWTFFSFAHLF